MAQGFGRKGLTDRRDHEIARRREAFIASERARNGAQPAVRDAPSPASAALSHHEPQQAPARYVETPAARTTHVAPRAEKSLLLTYALWFFAGTWSAHRLYLGAWRSALVQLGLFYGGLGAFYLEVHDKIMPASQFTPMATISMGSWVFGLLWMIFDVFLIPGIRRRIGERTRPQEMGAVFA